jgi:glycosyltransferase involved in cell wall biosynthesis
MTSRLWFWRKHGKISDKKRVAIIKYGFYPEHNHVRRDAETLVSQGYEVDVYVSNDGAQKSFEVFNGVNVYRFAGGHKRGNIFMYIYVYTMFFFMVMFKLSFNSLKRRYDVIEVDTMPDYLVFTALFPKMMGTKVILYMFENMAELFTSTFKKKSNHMITRIIRMCEKISAGYADHIISADGQYYKKVLISHGIKAEKIDVIQNVPNEDLFKAQGNASPDKNDHFRVITHGSIIKRYGVQVLVRAIPALIKEIPELRVDVVGDGEYLQQIKELSSQLGISDYIRFTGRVSHEQVPVFIAGARIGVAPMVDDVGVPNKVFEYFALGRPVVLSSHPSLRDTFPENCVAFFKPDDEKDLASKIIDIYRHPEKANAQVKNASEFYRKNQWSNLKNEYLKIYQELLTHG